MKYIILIAVFIAIAQTQDLAEAFTQLSSADPERCKLDWRSLTSAVKALLKDVQCAKQTEDDNQQVKAGLYQKLITLHDRTLNQIKVDTARQNTKLTDQLQPYKNELDEGLKYRAKILEQQKTDLKTNDYDYSNQKAAAQDEMNQVSAAITAVDQMRREVAAQVNGSGSFIEMKSSLESFHKQITGLSKQDSPLLTLAASLQDLLQLDFKERKVLKDLQALLDQFWMISIDYRIELVAQGNRAQQLYEERRGTVLADKETTIELYNSKVESFNQVSEEIASINTYLESRKQDMEDAANAVDFYKNIWGLNEGIATNVGKALTSKASAIQDALKLVGDGVSFQSR